MTINLAEAIPPEAIAVHVEAPDWKSALLAANAGLEATGSVTDAYGEEMIEAVEKHGPYIVIAPGVALAHGRPSSAVLRTGLSLVTLANPVEFGSPANDPVTVVVGLAATDHDSHLEVMASLAGVLGDPATVQRLSEANNAAAISEILAGA